MFTLKKSINDSISNPVKWKNAWIENDLLWQESQNFNIVNNNGDDDKY